MSDIEFNINSDVKRFEEWLDRYSLRTLPFIIDLDEDRALSVIGGPTYEKEFQGLRRHVIKASFSTISLEEPDAEVLSFPFTVVEIEIQEPTEKRLFVQARCRHTAMRPYFLEMMREIAKLWPETETAIRKLFPEEGRENKEEEIITPNNNADIQASQNSIAQTEEEILIDKACIEWAGRRGRLLFRQNMSDFLKDFYDKTKIYLTVDVFKKALKDAGRRGLIEKVNRRWRLPENST